MALPSYIVNLSEIKEPIKQAISEANIQTNIGNITIDSSSIKIDLSPLVDSIDQLNLLFGKSVDLQKQTSDSVKIVNTTINKLITTNTEIMDVLSTNFPIISQNLIKIDETLTRIIEVLGLNGYSKITGDMMKIEGFSTLYTSSFILDSTKDVFINGITIAQSAYNLEDYWSLTVSGVPLVTKSFSKLKGEYKVFKNPYRVPANTPIVLEFNNKSLSSKILWFDYSITVPTL